MKKLFVVIAMAALASCGGSETPAPVDSPAAPIDTPVVAQPDSAATQPDSAAVKADSAAKTN